MRQGFEAHSGSSRLFNLIGNSETARSEDYPTGNVFTLAESASALRCGEGGLGQRDDEMISLLPSSSDIKTLVAHSAHLRLADFATQARQLRDCGVKRTSLNVRILEWIQATSILIDHTSTYDIESS